MPLPKLFAAMRVPAAIASQLVLVQPLPMAGARIVLPDQMHVTLHFVGEANLDMIIAALQGVTAPALEVAIEGTGHFRSADGTTVLWAGVRRSPSLTRLHCAIGRALAGVGIRLEERSYTPHITLARCAPNSSMTVVDEFLSRSSDISLLTMRVDEFGLYSSAFVDGAPVYLREKSFPLVAEATWAVHRQDDNGKRFIVATGFSRAQAEELVAVFEKRGHKQLYWLEEE